MNVSIPLYIEERRPAGQATMFVVRPLFTQRPVRQAELLGRAVMRLTQDLRMMLADLGQRDRHDELARMCWAPDLAQHLLPVPVRLRHGDVKVKMLIASWPFAGREVAFSPSVPGVYFDVPRTSTLLERASDVYTAHYRALEKEGGALPAQPDRAWLSWAELSVNAQPVRKSAADERKLAVARLEKVSGEIELMRTGTCLSWEDPDALPVATGRDGELEQLEGLLAQKTRRPVVLLGPRQVGKTALVQELVRHSAERKDRKAIWHLSPQRIIAGMSYVGQWEQRVLAILDTAARKDLVLYFDDVLGLYAAGRSSVSDLAVAHVLRTRVEERRVRVLAEMTPEQFRLLKERDRGFADLFHVLPVRETSGPETLRIAIGLVRELEGRHGCRFALDALPAVLDLVGRYARDLAFPGKAATFLRELAVKFAGAEVTRDHVLGEFAARSGLQVSFLDRRIVTQRQKIRDALASRVIGQPAAIEALTDAVVVARAQMSDPGRPLASLLFLGPTGVGKTECARALAHHLFGDASRLIRLDMNEFVAPGSSARLVGTFAEPEGLLTAAVRRQPCSIVLLDEVEKAHSDVLDLLLQILGDGRLTDGRGRTTDFANCFVVLTSNLGAREASETLGFGAGARDAGLVYRRAAERFFRPELFNRFDRVVPFGQLERGHIWIIARGLIEQVLARGGLTQRRCQLTVDPLAWDAIVDEGFHPELGARALKRAIESRIAQPVAERLAALSSSAPAVMRVVPGPTGIAVTLDTLVPRVRPLRAPIAGRAADLLDHFEAKLATLETALEALAPPGDIEAGRVTPEQLRYLALRGQAARASGLREHLARRAASKAASRGPAKGPVRRVTADLTATWRAVLESEAPADALVALATDAVRYGESLADRLEELAGEVVLLERMVASARTGAGTTATLIVTPLTTADRRAALALAGTYQAMFADWEGFSARSTGDWEADHRYSMVIEGPAAADLCALEHGTHVKWIDGQHLVQVSGDRSTALGPVVRMYRSIRLTADVDTGILFPGNLDPTSLRHLLTARLEPA